MCDDIERARNQLESKLSSMGYVHPEEAKPKTNHVYKTINVKDEKAQYESSAKKANPYGSFSHDYDGSTVQKTRTCPACQEQALFACDCTEYGDMMCSNDHTWWVDKKGVVHLEDPHEGED
jgi:hypothetical protein